jgi:hypothetical protein
MGGVCAHCLKSDCADRQKPAAKIANNIKYNCFIITSFKLISRFYDKDKPLSNHSII